MKEGVRVLAIACAPAEKKKILLVGVVSRKGYIEGILSTYVTVDGTDSAKVVAKMLKGSKFNGQVGVVVMNGIGVAGLNIFDIREFEKMTRTKVLSITRARPRPTLLIKALNAFSRDEGKNVDDRIALVEKLGRMGVVKGSGFYAQTTLDKDDATRFMGNAFELVRLAHLIARGVSSGESKGRI